MPHRRIALTTAACGAAAAASAGVAVAPAAPSAAGSTRAAGQPTVISLSTRVVQQTFLDLGRPGFSQGDQQVFSEDVLHNGRKIGADGGTITFTWTKGNDFQAQVVVTATLPDGQLTLQERTGQNTASELAITGGTGAYRRAGGYALRKQTGESTAELTLHLTTR